MAPALFSKELKKRSPNLFGRAPFVQMLNSEKFSDKTLEAYTGLRRDVISVISRSPSNVLDVGCSSGVLLDYLKCSFGAKRTVGLEGNELLALEAQTKADRVVLCDLDFFRADLLTGEKFDLVILSDVLEHTKQPLQLLINVLNSATEDAEIIISLPNIQHWTGIWGLLCGTWPERDRGLFDRTHLRFFTLKSICELGRNAGLAVDTVARNYRIVDRPGAAVNRLLRFVKILPLGPYFTYQYVVRFKRTRIGKI